MRKIERTGGKWTKKNFLPPSFVVGSCLLVVLCSWHSVHRHSGAHSVKTGWWRGGVDRGHVGSCCKPNRGHLIRGITFCVTFPNQHPLVFLLFCQFGCMLGEENSWLCCCDWANIGRCVPDMCRVPSTLFWWFVIVWKVLFFSWAFVGCPFHLCASLQSWWSNFAHRCSNWANIGQKVDGIGLFRTGLVRFIK